MTGYLSRRRALLGLAGAAAVSRPAPLFAQSAPPIIGFLGSGSAAAFKEQGEALARGLRETGFIVGQNVQIDYRWAENQYDRLPAMAAELVRRPVSVIVAAGGNVSAIVAKAATSSIPIVFTGTADPVTIGLVASLNRPGGNVTGISIYTYELDAKRLELLREIVPATGVTAVIVNPHNPSSGIQVGNIESAARLMGREIALFRAGNAEEIDSAFGKIAASSANALLVASDPFFTGRRNQVVGLAARHAIPAIYQWREFAESGGLISYGPSITYGYYQSGIYVGRILKGEKPADLPVLRPAQLEMIINLKTARTLGVTVPATILARADEVIE